MTATKMKSKNEIINITTSLVTGSVTFFLGTGFSQNLTDDKIPSWIKLLYQCAVNLEENYGDKEIVRGLFIIDDENIECRMSETICAQILQDTYRSHGMNLKEYVAELIIDSQKKEHLDASKVEKFQQILELCPKPTIVTTNYDNLISEHILPNKSKPVVEGSLIPKTANITPIYHIHGSVHDPKSMVLTDSDYFNFLHKETYLSRKLFTSLHESTVVILGYSLKDFNLNRVLNEAKTFLENSIYQGNIYYISNQEVSKYQEMYYRSTLGIKVLDELSIDDLFDEIMQQVDKAKEITKTTEQLHANISGLAETKTDFIKLNSAFSQILLAADVHGYQLTDENFLAYIIDILKKKKQLTRESHAWEQYSHLAEWLVDLGTRLEVRGTPIEEDYIDLVHYSISKMSITYRFGFAWQAHSVWKKGWKKLLTDNKNVIKESFKGKKSPDEHTGFKDIMES